MNKYSIVWHDDFYDTELYQSVKLVIQFNTVFKLIDTYYIYRYNDGIELTIWTYANKEEDASIKINNANALLTYLYGILIRSDNYHLLETLGEIEPPFSPSIKRGNLARINSATSIVQVTQPSRKKALFEVLGCYSAGLKFFNDRFYPEALITFFRIFESIGLSSFEGYGKNSLHYPIDKIVFENDIQNIVEKHFRIYMRKSDYQNITNELVNKLISKIKNEAYSLIAYLLTQYNIQYNPIIIDTIVEMRNNITHMKGTLYAQNDIQEACNALENFAVELIARHFFNKKYSSLHLKSNIEF